MLTRVLLIGFSIGKTRLRTQTIKKQLDPEWNKSFTVPVNDVFQTLRITGVFCLTLPVSRPHPSSHASPLCFLLLPLFSALLCPHGTRAHTPPPLSFLFFTFNFRLSVYDEDDGGKKADFLGCLEFPLLWIPSSSSALSQWFALKDSWLEGYAGGDINIYASFEYKNPQCLLALLNNREVDMMRKEPEFTTKLLSKYVDELKILVMEIVNIFIFIEGCFSAKHGFFAGVLTVGVWAAITLYMQIWHVFLSLSLSLWYNLW